MSTQPITTPPETLKHKQQEFIRIMVTIGMPFAHCTREFKKEFIVQTLYAFKGNQCKAARALNKHRNTLARDIAELRIDATEIRRSCTEKWVNP
jgi:DNA-binding NtrC family response regulator